MANEIKVRVTLDVNKGGAAMVQNLALTLTMAGDEMISNVQTVGTTVEAVVVGDVTTIGYVLMKNLDATNFVLVGVDAAGTENTIKMLAGDVCLFPASAAALYAKADTAACKLLVMAAEI